MMIMEVHLFDEQRQELVLIESPFKDYTESNVSRSMQGISYKSKYVKCFKARHKVSHALMIIMRLRFTISTELGGQ